MMNAIEAGLAKLMNGHSAAVPATASETVPALLPPAASRAGHRLNIVTSCYVAAVVAGAAVCVVFFGKDITLDRWQGLVTLCILAVLFERIGLKIYGDTHVSAGVVALFAIAVLYDVPGVAVAAPLVVLAATVMSSASWYQRLFDMGSYTLAGVSAALVFHALPGVGEHASAWWLPAAVLAAFADYVVNIVLVAGVVSVSSGQRIMTVWRDEHQWIFPYYIIFGMLGIALAAAYLALGIPGIMAFVAPPLMMRFALHQYVTKTEQTVLELKHKNAELESANRNILQMTRQLTETYDGTLEALVLALDARDHETRGHSFRVAQYVMTMAQHIGVDQNTGEWVDMQRGALLHDVGKIGVPDYILHKPGPLTPEEWNDMKRHPHIGHEMLKEISFLSGAAAIVHSHHERFDGKGYPRGLAGDEVPLGARVFAVADAFDAMTSDRPYRRALTADMARDEIVRHSGTQFDPQVVQVFLLVYDNLAKHAASSEHREEHAVAA